MRHRSGDTDAADPAAGKARRRLVLPDLSGRTILVTGASSGIGRVAALRLAEAGATVLPHGRSPEKTAAVARSVGAEPLIADFVRLDEVRRLAEEVRRRTPRLDAVLHNAGTMFRHRVLTGDGHESTFQTNYLAPFLLQHLLNDLVVLTPGSRVVISTSVAARWGKIDLDDLEHSGSRYRAFLAYTSTKLAGILFAQELRRRLAAHVRSTAPAVAAVHPGAVGSSIGSGSMFPGFLYHIPIKKYLLIGFFVYTPEEGASPLLWLLTRPEPPEADVCYFDRFVPKGPPSTQAADPGLAQDLWNRTEALLGRWL